MMSVTTIVRTWFCQFRVNFLLLSVVLVAIGYALAVRQMGGVASINYFDLFLLVVGVGLAHASVNLFNDYFDHGSGIDAHTLRTPFSGGSGMLQAGRTSPSGVLYAAIGILLCAALIGIYFCFTVHWFLIPLTLVGGGTIVLYTRYLSKWLLGEFFTGLTLGTFVVWGSFIVLTGSHRMDVSVEDILPLHVLLISIIPGILTFLLLFLNEFPDMDADKKGGRFHLVILLGRTKSVYLYLVGLASCYGLIFVLPLYGITHWWILLAGITLPLAVAAGFQVYRHANNITKLVPALGMNVLIVLCTDALLACALLIDVCI